MQTHKLDKQVICKEIICSFIWRTIPKIANTQLDVGNYLISIPDKRLHLGDSGSGKDD